jgi:multiple sugar transport system permease protein
MFLAALQDLPVEVDEAAMLDGVSPWQKLRLVTIPMLKPALFLVITLGIIGTWQVFDQIYVMGKGAPAGTTMTPAFLSYKTSFTSNGWGSGAAIAFVIFLIIVILTGIQRRMMREDKPAGRLRRAASRARPAQSNKAAATADLAHTNSGTGPES